LAHTESGSHLGTEPWPVMRFCVAPSPTRALPTALPIGGHCGGDRSLHRLRAVVARTNWRAAYDSRCARRMAAERGVLIGQQRLAKAIGFGKLPFCGLILSVTYPKRLGRGF
jgi:hypothetical protein